MDQADTKKNDFPKFEGRISLESARVSLKYLIKENQRLRILNTVLGGDFDKHLQNVYLKALKKRLKLSEKANQKKRKKIQELKQEIEILKSK